MGVAYCEGLLVLCGCVRMWVADHLLASSGKLPLSDVAAVDAARPQTVLTSAH